MAATFCGIALTPIQSQAQFFVNPGFKVGITSKGGITLGPEITIGYFKIAYSGVSAGLDFTFNHGDMNQKSAFLRLYLDIEGGLAFVGTGIGGVLILENGKIKPGY